MILVGSLMFGMGILKRGRFRDREGETGQQLGRTKDCLIVV